MQHPKGITGMNPGGGGGGGHEGPMFPLPFGTEQAETAEV